MSLVNRSTSCLRQSPPLGVVFAQAVQDGEQMQGKHSEAAFERVGKAVTQVKGWKPRLCHNRAIEFFGVVASAGAAALQAVLRGQIRGISLEMVGASPPLAVARGL
jgi:hypothetical protein